MFMRKIQNIEWFLAILIVLFCLIISKVSGSEIPDSLDLTEQKSTITKETCEDPDKLSEELKKAYYQLKEAGFDVKIFCKRREIW